MTVKGFSVYNFRNLENISIELSPSVNVFYGDNAQGKTNLLEAVYICSTGRSQRSANDKEIIRFTERDAHVRAIIENVYETASFSDVIDVHLKRDEKKGVAVNAIPVKKLSDLLGNLVTVVFSPEDLSLLKNGPVERRRFMDIELCQISKPYYNHIQQYYKVLKHRNNLLKSIQRNPQLAETLDIWDAQLVEHGTKIMDYRKRFADDINIHAADIHKQISGTEQLHIEYRPNITDGDFEKRLKRNLERDIATGMTSSGSHKDDLMFSIDGKDARIYGSQGQQRTACLSAKMAEVFLIKDRLSKDPVLLLDDVLSELDEKRQRFLLKGISGIQTLLTCTGYGTLTGTFDKAVLANSKLYRVKNGNIENDSSK